MNLGDPIAAISNVADQVASLEQLLGAILFLVGAVLVIQSIRLAARRSELGAQAVTAGRIVSGLVAGSALLAFPYAIATFQGTLFGSTMISDPSSVFAYDQGLLDPVEGSRDAVTAIVTIIQLIGFIAVARGILFLNQATVPGGPSSFGPGATFIVAGTLAVNFPQFLGLMADLFVEGS